jgi:hypothetical protein
MVLNVIEMRIFYLYYTHKANALAQCRHLLSCAATR